MASIRDIAKVIKVIEFQERLKVDTPIVYDGGFGTQLFERDINLPNSTQTCDPRTCR